jgi:hypothetical protein
MTGKAGVIGSLLVASTLLFACDEAPDVVDPGIAGAIQSVVGKGGASISRRIPCTGGGGLTVRGAITEQTTAAGSGRTSLDVVVTPHDCSWMGDGGPYEIDGRPNLTLHGTRAVLRDEPAREINGLVRGSVGWVSPAGRGVCRFEVSFRIDVKPPLSVVLRGTECGKKLIREAFLLDQIGPGDE